MGRRYRRAGPKGQRRGGASRATATASVTAKAPAACRRTRRLALAVAVALVAALSGGSSSRPAARIREVVDPAPHRARPPIRTHRREPRNVSKPHDHGERAGTLEGEREPKAIATTPEPYAPDLAPEPTVEPTIEPPPKTPPPTPAPSTSATAEFGL